VKTVSGKVVTHSLA